MNYRRAWADALPVVCLIGVFGSVSANAASVSYFLDQSNENILLPDGNNYLQVTIDDQGAMGTVDQLINFTVEIVAGSAIAGAGIDKFGFNVVSTATLPPDSGGASDPWTLPTNWSALVSPPPNQQDGFGKFDIEISTSGATNRLDPLTFSLDITGDSVTDYIDLSGNPAGEGNVFFSAHVAGFDISGTTSAFFGGSTPVPVPAAAWLFGSGLLGLVGIARRKAA